MEIYIGDIRLPVVEPTFEIQEVHDNEEQQVVGFGGVNLIGKRGLKTFNYSSFYPKTYDPSYCNFRNLLKPATFVNKILDYKNSTNKVRLVIPKMQINGLYSIEGFSYRAGEGTEDIYYSISMKEYQLPTQVATNYSFEDYNVSYLKEEKVVDGQYYTVKDYDTLVTVARKFNMSVSVLYLDNQSTIGNSPADLVVGTTLWIRGNAK